jgi:hypothetical protein
MDFGRGPQGTKFDDGQLSVELSSAIEWLIPPQKKTDS